MRTIKLFGGDLGDEAILVRCDLVQAAAPVAVNFSDEPDGDWEPTQYQCADARHRIGGLVRLAEDLAAQACEIPADEFACEWTEI